MPGRTSATKSPSTGARANSEQPGRGERRGPATSGGWMPKRITSFAERPSENSAHDQVGGQEREADLQRAVAEHQLQVERGEEEPGEHRRRPERPRPRSAAADVAEPEQAERHQRRGDPRLDDEERRPAAPRRRRAARASRPTSSRARCRSRSRRRRASAPPVTVTAPATSSASARPRPGAAGSSAQGQHATTMRRSGR